jgi:energy-coupling factor transport system ATP-binding protein
VSDVVTWSGVGFAYPDRDRTLAGLDLAVPAGDVVVVLGSSGSGKSTFLRTVNGLVPHTSGGRFRGDVVVHGRSTRTHAPRDLADVVGFVHQDPEAQFVVDHVEHDLAFVLENLGTDAQAMRRRVEEVLDALGIAHLRDRSPSTLSGGERQRCAIAGALAAAPSVLVLDEPTSELDPQGAEDVLAAVGRLNADLGTTVILAEHRLERVAALSHRALLIDGGRVAAGGEPADVVVDYDGAPPVTHLGRLLGWSPLPLTVRDAQQRARAGGWPPDTAVVPPPGPARVEGDVARTARGVEVRHGGRSVLRDATIEVRAGEVVALLGRNGAGKTTLLRALGGLQTPDKGTVHGPGSVAYVPQDPNVLLFASSVRAELDETLRLRGLPDDGRVEHWLAALRLEALADRHPRTLSSGERQRVAVAAIAVGGADVLLLDEPTRGIDAASRAALEVAVDEHAAAGGTVVLATHDIELAARCASRVVVMGDGEIVADGPAREVLSGSLFAPQVLRVLPPFLTVDEVRAAREAEVAR